MRTKLSIVFASLALVVLAGCASVPPVSEIPDAIAVAKTAPEHLRIADYFAQKAANYDAEAVLHEKMGRSYTARPKGEVPSMVGHCRTLKDQFTSAAAQARALEQAHRQLAASLSK